MSSVVIYGDTSGAITLAANAVAGTNTITIPARTGTMLTTATPGTILQVVYGSYSNLTTVTSTTFTDSGLSATITPSSTTSKIYVSCSLMMSVGAANQGGGVRLVRGATTILDPNPYDGTGPYGIYTAASSLYYGMPLMYLDSPSNTSALTYKIQMRAYTTGYSNTLGMNGATGVTTPGTSTITLMEVAA